MNQMIEKIKRIYNSLGDDESKKIFDLRLLYSFTHDEQIEKEILLCNKSMRRLQLLLEEKKNCKLFLYSAGRRGRNLLWGLHEYWNGIIEKNTDLIGTKIEGVQVYSIDQIKDNCREIIVVIPNKYEAEEIEESLITSGVPEGNIIRFDREYTSQMEAQYFDLENMVVEGNEVFVDCGAYDGVTAKLFAKWCGDAYRHIYCFEPDTHNIEKCKETIENSLDRTKCTIIPKGTWSKSQKLCFSSSADVASHICDDSDESIEVTTIDKEFLENRDEPITFIKMDIEGAELESLKGAQQIIKKYSPKLAISVYHKPEDIVTIPDYINEINDSYTFYLRHYSFNVWDTILYAIP